MASKISRFWVRERARQKALPHGAKCRRLVKREHPVTGELMLFHTTKGRWSKI